ncbi:uncharacterized protein, partial [Lepeophtheirus salmonis]|uniref:uncharacterized protein n=1 Tax=Lepeophtheirus salmonis TaxID=72036 RepID=UPI003AF36123
MFDDYCPSIRKSKRQEDHEKLIIFRRKQHLEKLRNFIIVDDLTKISDLIEIKNKIKSKDIDEILSGATQFRSYLSSEKLPPIQTVIDSGVVPRFVELLSIKCSVYNNVDAKTIKPIRLESAWVLTNIASGSSEQTKVVVEYGAAPLLVDMLTEADVEIVDQAIWALGNISGDGEKTRDMIIYSKGVESIIYIGNKLIGNSEHIKILRNLTWLLSNLNRGKCPPPPIESVEKSAKFLNSLLKIDDLEILSDGFWAASYISDSGKEGSVFILDSEVFDIAIKILKNSRSERKPST